MAADSRVSDRTNMRIGGVRLVALAAVALAATTGQAWAAPVAINDARQQQQQLFSSGGNSITTKDDGAGLSVLTSVDGQLSVELTVASAAQVRSRMDTSGRRRVDRTGSHSL